jgi:hypothetical protein
MSSALKSTDGQSVLKRAEHLKQELMKFATTGPLKDEYKRQHNLFFELANEVDEREAESMLDWFLFDWFDPNGEGVIDYFLDSHPDLSEEDQDILLDWESSVDSVFEIRSLDKNSLQLKELGETDKFTVITTTPIDETPFKRGQFIAARLLPLGDRFIFSGLQFIMPDRQSAMEALEMRRALDALDSPEAIENAQREQCSAFCELFGCDELTVPSSEINSTLQKFQRYVFAERRDPETGMTPAERFEKEFGRELNVPDMPPLPDILSSAGNVTILCDDFDGIVLLPDFQRFRSVFESKAPEKEVPDWQELVWKYVKDPDIPIVAFEHVAEKFPERVETVLSKLMDDKDFSLEHLYAVLLHYKQPVDGLDDLEADRQLWDLFDGNSKPTQARGKSKAKAASSETGSNAAPKKQGTAKKAATSKVNSNSSKKAAAKSKPAAKSSKANKIKAATRNKPQAAAKAASGRGRAQKRAPQKRASQKSAPRKSASRKKR